MDASVVAKPAPDEPSPNQLAPDASRKIFISYAHADKEFALGLANDLRAAKLSVWIDESEIPGGADWARTIEEAIYDCTEFVLILSPNSRTSDYVANELIHAKSLKKTIRPVLYQTCERWVHINNVQSIDFRENPAKGLKQLKEPPRQTLSQRILVFHDENRASRPYLAVLALVLGIAAAVYFLSPSNTSFSVSGDDHADIVMRVRNEGGRPSMLVGSSFKLYYRRLPIETETLVLRQPANIRIAGHADVVIHLTDDKSLKPKKKSDDSWYSWDDVRPLLPGKMLTLEGQVEESDEHLYTRSYEFPAPRIENFIREVYPDVPH